jgi:hypothetical protein
VLLHYGQCQVIPVAALVIHLVTVATDGERRAVRQVTYSLPLNTNIRRQAKVPLIGFAEVLLTAVKTVPLANLLLPSAWKLNCALASMVTPLVIT